jgi:TonB family protein
MKSKAMRAGLLGLLTILMPVISRADLYSASAAAEKKDFARAFELYGELAQIGLPEAQENLAVMYVNGEGVKRDNVLGYAWAAIALENGGGEAAKGIVAQLEPHLTTAARSRVAEVQARFGKASLEERLLPKVYVPGMHAGKQCEMRVPANPDTYYPYDAKIQMVSGTVMVEATVAPDGRARNARVWYSLPAKVFDEAGRRVAMNNIYTPPRENGVPVTCTMRFKVRFRVTYGNGGGGDDEQKKVLADVRTKAESGDPRSQLTYGLLLDMRDDMNVSHERPLSWFLKSAQAGVATAQYLVGMNCLAAAPWAGENESTKGLAWLQMAVDAGQIDAQVAMANYLLRSQPGADSFSKALGLVEKAAASDSRDGKYYLAALLATGEDAARRDPKRALELISTMKDEFEFDPTFYEIRAAAEAMLGDFEAAQKDQKTAVSRARKYGWNLADQQARLASYQASKPWTGNLFAY